MEGDVEDCDRARRISRRSSRFPITRAKCSTTRRLRSEEDKEDVFYLNENKFGSEKEDDCGEDLVSSDLCE